MLGLSCLFFVIALFYSMVGFGGGSSYIALLALSDIPYYLLPSVALICNLIVVTGGCFYFLKAGHLKWEAIWPFAITSIPFSYLGGRIPVSKEIFLFLLSASLLASGFRLSWRAASFSYSQLSSAIPLWKSSTLGASLGFLAGVVGIGGGIFLSPFLLNFKWESPKRVAAIASGFIFVNSLAGLAGQIMKNQVGSAIGDYWPLFLAVLLGGQMGSRFSSSRFSQKMVCRLTGILVIAVGGRLFIRILFQF